MPTFTKFSELPPAKKKKKKRHFKRSSLRIFTEKSPLSHPPPRASRRLLHVAVPARRAPHCPALPRRAPPPSGARPAPRRPKEEQLDSDRSRTRAPGWPRAATHSSGALPAARRSPNPTGRRGRVPPFPPARPPTPLLGRGLKMAERTALPSPAPPHARPCSPSSRRLAPRPRAPPLVSPRPPGPGSSRRRLTIPRRGRPPSSCPRQRQGRRTRPTSRRSAEGRPQALRRRKEECARRFREPPAAPQPAHAGPEVERPSLPTRAPRRAKLSAHARPEVGRPSLPTRAAGSACARAARISSAPL